MNIFLPILFIAILTLMFILGMGYGANREKKKMRYPEQEFYLRGREDGYKTAIQVKKDRAAKTRAEFGN